MNLLITNGRVIDPAAGLDSVADVLVRDGKITAIGRESAVGDARDVHDIRVVDASGLIVAPGLIDMHVHLREPGQEWKEDIASGTRAAAAGGFTSVAAMPNTVPVIDDRPGVEYVLRAAARAGAVNVYPIGAITKGSKGEELAEMGDMYEVGAVAFSDDGRPVMNAEVMRCALEYARMFPVPVIAHCEDTNLSNEGYMNLGPASSALGLRGMPNAAEDVMVARDLILAGLTGGRLHVAHVSTAGAVELIRQAKRRGVRVTAEVAPHHLALTDRAVADSVYDTNTKVNPPLRTAADVAALVEGLRDGTIDAIASDHAPHHRDDKEVEYMYAAFGISGLETALPLALTVLCGEHGFPIAEVLRLLTAGPARALGLDRGTLAVGAAADITLIDPRREVVVDPATFYSKGKNTPFAGRRLRGAAVMTIVGGRIVMEDRKVLV